MGRFYFRFFWIFESIRIGQSSGIVISGRDGEKPDQQLTKAGNKGVKPTGALEELLPVRIKREIGLRPMESRSST